MITKQTIKPILISLALLSSCTSGAASFIPPSTDSDYNYIGFRAGGVLPMNTRGNTDLQSVSPNSTYIAGMSIGRKFNDRFAVEIEYMNRGKSSINSSAKTNASSASNSWGVSSNSLMLNFVADLMAKDLATPYVKFGAGISRNYASTYTYTDSTKSASAYTQTWKSRSLTEIAWQAAFGVNMSVTKSIDANIEYAFIDRGQFKTQNQSTQTNSGGDISNTAAPQTGKLREQALTLGFKVKF